MFDPKTVWSEFIGLMKSSSMTMDRIRPLHPSLREPVFEILQELACKVPPSAWPNDPALQVRGNHVICQVALSPRHAKPGHTEPGHAKPCHTEPCRFIFTFEVDGDHWFFRHLESITILMDSVPPLPASSFPDLPEATKAWIRAEVRATEDVRLFNYLNAERGHRFALDWFRDGQGYSMAARSWLPLLPEPAAFVLYLCWEQSVLSGSKVTLEHLDEQTAAVRICPICLQVYERAVHLKQQIPREDYEAVFEVVWEDRALAAGWHLDISWARPDCAELYPVGPDCSDRDCAGSHCADSDCGGSGHAGSECLFILTRQPNPPACPSRPKSP